MAATKRENAQASPGADIRLYAVTLVSQRLDRLAYQAGLAAAKVDDETIHDLRVSIRRFTQSLRAFAQFFPKSKVKRIRKRLRVVMTQAGEVRNRDITMALLRAGGTQEKSEMMTRLAGERGQAHGELLRQVNILNHKNLPLKWRSGLGL